MNYVLEQVHININFLVCRYGRDAMYKVISYSRSFRLEDKYLFSVVFLRECILSFSIY